MREDHSEETFEKKSSLGGLFLVFGGVFFLMILAWSPRGKPQESIRAVSPSVAAAVVTIPRPQIPPPELGAHAYLVRFIGDSRTRAAKREWKPMAPASLAKIMTSLIAWERLSAGEWFPVSAEARNIPEKRSRVRAGEALVRDDLIRLALISSANDAATALAEAVGRQEGARTFSDAIILFVNLMNRRAGELGLSSSSFSNPTGLDTDSQFASAEDLARLAEYIWKNKKEIWQMTREAHITLNSDAAHAYDTESTNELLNEFPALLGGKTGFTDRARENLVLLYPVRPDRIAIIIILGSENRFADGRAIIRWLEENFK